MSAALVGLVGIVVGAVLAGATTYYLEAQKRRGAARARLLLLEADLRRFVEETERVAARGLPTQTVDVGDPGIASLTAGWAGSKEAFALALPVAQWDRVSRTLDPFLAAAERPGASLLFPSDLRYANIALSQVLQGLEGRRALAHRAAPAVSLVKFGDLVEARFYREKTEHETTPVAAAWDRHYQLVLSEFEAWYGAITQVYFSASFAGGAALTTQSSGRRRREQVTFHYSIGRASGLPPNFTGLLIQLDGLAKVIEIELRGVQQRIAAGWLVAAASHVLGYIDGQRSGKELGDESHFINDTRNEIDRLVSYIDRATEKQRFFHRGEHAGRTSSA